MALDPTPSELSQLIFTDDLTGLYNRRYLYSFLTRRVNWKDKTHPLSLVMCDLDHFKDINDLHGHLEGDQAILILGRLLKGLFRPEDVLVRYAGDEFCALLPGVGKTEAIQMAETARTRVAGEIFRTRRENSPISVTVSLGVATFPDDADAPERLIDEADQALYQSKRRGRNRTSAAGDVDASLVAERDPFVGLPCPAFLGRDDEAEEIRAHMAELRDGRNTMIVFNGVPGVGKSRMLREIMRWAKDEGMIYLFAHCSETGMFSPYKLLSQLVVSYIADQRDAAERLAKRLTLEELTVLREVIPPLQEIPLKEKIELNDRERRRALYEGLVGILWDMTQHEPLVILLDNLQYADRGTLEVLRQLLRPGAARVMVAGALFQGTSDSENFSNSFLGQLLEEADRNGVLSSVTLRPFDAEGVARMISTILPDSDRPADFEKLLFDASGGNPLYVEEAVRALLLNRKIVKTGSWWKVSPVSREDLPGSLDGAIDKVLAQLPAEAGEFLTNAAIIGGEFDLRLLKEVMGGNAGRTQDMADRVRSTKIIQPRPGGAPDEYEFTDAQTRDHRYRTTPMPERQEIHRKIGAAEEKLHPEAADVLAFHYEKGGDAAKAEQFRQVREERTSQIFRQEEVAQYAGKKGDRRERIPEAAAPPSPALVRKVEAFLRSFCSALKMVRLYPQWSQHAGTFLAQVRTAVDEMLAESGTVTLAAEPRKLVLNGAPLNEKARDSMAGDVAGILHDHLIARLTLVSGIDPRELDFLIETLVSPLDRAQAKPDHWDALLGEKNIRHFDVVQRTYVPQQAETTRRTREIAALREKPLEPAQLHELAGAVRHLKAGVDNVKLYPPGHQLVEAALEGAHHSLIRLLDSAKIVTLTVAEDGLVVNGAPADPRLFGDAAGSAAALIAAHDLKSVTFIEGITRDEVSAVVSGFSRGPKEAKWTDILGGIGARHVLIGERLFQLRDSGRREKSPTTRRFAVEKDAATRAQAYLAAPREEILSERFAKDFRPLLEALLVGADAPLGHQLLDRLLAWTSDADGEHRRRSWVLFLEGVRSLSEGPRQGCLEHAVGLIVARLGAESFDAAWEALLHAAEFWIRELIARRDWNTLRPVLLTIRGRASDQALAPSIEALLALLGSQGSFASLLDAYRTGVAADQARATAILGAVGITVAPGLVALIPQLPAFPARQAAHEALRAASPRGVADLARSITATTDADACRRILEVVDLSGLDDAAELCMNLVLHRDPTISAEAFRLVRRLPEEIAGEVVKRALKTPDAALHAAAISCAADLHISGVGPEVARVLRDTHDERLMRACCAFLAKNPVPDTVSSLARVLRARPRYFGIRKGYADETRAAAAWALAAAGGDEAKRILESEALTDKSAAVRSAAKLGRK